MLYDLTGDPFFHIAVTNKEKLIVKTKSITELEEICAIFTYSIAQIPIFFKDKRRELPRKPVSGNMAQFKYQKRIYGYLSASF